MNDFIKYLESKSFSKSTQNHYGRNVNHFKKWYGDDVMSCTKKDILSYLEHLHKKGLQNRTRGWVLTAMNHYFTFLVENKVIAGNPAALIKIRGTRKCILYNIYSPQQLSDLYDNYYHTFIRSFDDSRIPLSTRQRCILSRERNYIMLGLLLYQGLQPGELHRITPDDVNLNKATLTIQGSKRINGRTLPLQAAQIGTLINYTGNIRPQLAELYNGHSNALLLPLPENNNNAAPAGLLNGTLQILTRQVKTLDKNFENFKQVRASVITGWLKTEGLRKTQYLAGHRYISSTEQYLPNSLEGLKDDIARYSPF